jgi:hypothetical protein
MLQGVSRTARKRHNKAAPDFLQGVMLRTQQCHTSITSKGAISASRQRHFSHAPTNFIWCQPVISAMPSLGRTKGRVTPWPQQCHMSLALPNQFNGVIYPARKRHRFVAPRGRVIRDPQKCLSMGALPSQFNGVIVKTQKCLDIVAPREKPYRSRRNADVVALLPSQFNGDTDMTQQCLDHNSPRERSLFHRSNAEMKTPLPTSLTGAITTSQKCYKVNAPREGTPIGRRNAIRAAPFPPVTGGHQRHAEMPDDLRPHRIWAIGMPQKCH